MESPIKVFSDWVINGKDEGMQKGHSPAVKNMLEYSTKELADYSFIDAGCGNGWVVRNIGSDPKCKKAIGVDGSLNMIEKAKKAAEEIKCKPKIMMVTILTALSDGDLKDMGNNSTVDEQVERLARVAKETNVGVVCSGQEAKLVRKIIGTDLLIFTPGIRMKNDSNNDQKRISTPDESIKNGANKIIMGRSLIKGNIEENIDKVSNSIKE